MRLGLGFGLDNNRYINRGAFTGLLDTYPNAALAESVRLLRTDYTSFLKELRRSSDNALKSFNPDANNQLSLSSEDGAGTSLSSWVTTDNSFVRTGFDQGDNSNNLLQNTAANQPQIITSGTLNTVNGKPAMTFNGSSSAMATTSVVDYSGASEIWIFMCVNIKDTASTQIILENSTLWFNSNGNFSMFIDAGDIYFTQRAGSANNINRCSISTGQKVIAAKYNITQTGLSANEVYINGALQVLTNSSTSGAGTSYINQKLYIGARDNSNFFANIDVQELIVKIGDQSANRAGIETNINNFYSIY